MSKHKNKVLIAVILFFIVAVPLIMAGCVNRGEVVKIELLAGTTSYRQYTLSENILKDIIITATYQNGDSKTVKGDDVEVGRGAVDTSVLGDQDVSVSYSGITIQVKIRILEEDVNFDARVIGYNPNENWNRYLQNSTVEDSTNDGVFKVPYRAYSVGNANSFSMFPVVTLLNSDESISISTANIFTSSFDFEVMGSNGQYIDLVENQDGGVDGVVSIVDAARSEIKFEASSGTYRITQRPTDTEYAYIQDVEDAEFVIEVQVVDGGWNAYNAYDLSRIDNSEQAEVYGDSKYAGYTADVYDSEGNVIGQRNVSASLQRWTRSIWDNFKASNNIQYVPIKAMILHNNISLTRADISSEFFTPEGLFKDERNSSGWLYQQIYRRLMAEGETFDLIGNYFSLNTEQLPLVDIDDGEVLAQTFLVECFGTDGIHDIGINKDFLDGGNLFTVRDIKSQGNSPRSTDIKYSAGLGFLKNETSESNFIVNNSIVLNYNQAFDVIMYNRTEIVDSKVLDSFSVSTVYNGSGEYNYITNSEIKRAGGPMFVTIGRGAMSGDQYSEEYRRDTDGDIKLVRPLTSQDATEKSFINIDSKSVVENWVTGREPWFELILGHATVGGLTFDPMVLIKAFNEKVELASNKTKGFLRIEQDGSELFNFQGVSYPRPPKPFQGIDLEKEPFSGGLRYYDADNTLTHNFDMGSDLMVKDGVDGFDSVLKLFRDGEFTDIVGPIFKGYGETRRSYAIGTKVADDPNGFLQALPEYPVIDEPARQQFFKGDYMSLTLVNFLAIQIIAGLVPLQ